MEHFRRENLLFESYIIRNTKDLGKEVPINIKGGDRRQEGHKKEKGKVLREKAIDQ